MTIESSIRFAVPARRKVVLLHHPALGTDGATEPQALLVERTYFDTANLDLRRQRRALYVRKGPRPSGATVENIVGDRGWIVLTERSAAPDDGKSPDLQPLFSAHLECHTRVLRTADARIEISLESGELRSNSRRMSILDLVLRVRGSSPRSLAALAAFAARVQGECGLRVESRGLAERGALLRQSMPPPVEHAGAFVLRPEMTTLAAFRAIVGQCVKLYRDNEDGVRDGEDPESVHQARVALRQLSSACSVFASAIPPHATAGLLAQVRWLGQILGGVRDWEVLRTETLAEAPTGTLDHVQLDAFDQALSVRVTQARARMRRALRSLRYARLQISLTEWLVDAPWNAAMSLQARRGLAAPVRDCADRELARRRRRLLKKGVRLEAATPEERHRVRIAAKKLRYAIDFFGSLYAEHETTEYLRALKKVQDVLGALNDNRVARERLREMAAIPMTAGHPPIRSVNLERYLRGQEAPLLEKLVHAWERLRDAHPPNRSPEL